jgi:pimeloyl-ACP methyl ester carboxylesterase
MKSGTADVNGTRIHYEERGKGSPLLFLHGFTLDRRMWSRQMDALARDHRVVAFDARGFGLSALPGIEPYRHCEDAAALCEHLGLERVVVVGHSIGAHQMLELALTRPDLVAGYVSVCGSGLGGIPFPPEVTAMFTAIRAAAKDEGIDAAKRIWADSEWIRPSHDTPAVSKEMDAMLEGYSGWHWTHDNPAQGITPPAAQRLASLATPALIVTGASDLPYNEVVAAALAEGIAGATRLRLAGTHMVNMEEPDAVSRAIAEIAARAR